jgi:hypothetical protein
MANGWFDFVSGQTLPASRVQDYLMNQSVMVFADSSTRSTDLSGVITEGMVTYLLSTQSLDYFDGIAWQPVGAAPAGTKNLDQFLLMGA